MRELVDYVDSHFRTIPQRDSRGITGCSMGAAGAIHLALKHPDVFSVAVPDSAPYDWGPVFYRGRRQAFYASAEGHGRFREPSPLSASGYLRWPLRQPLIRTTRLSTRIRLSRSNGKPQAVAVVWTG